MLYSFLSEYFVIPCGLAICFLGAHTTIGLSIYSRSKKEISMGQLLGLPISSENGGTSDERPKNISECYVNEEFNAELVQQYKKRSYDESRRVLIDLLFSSSKQSFLEEEDDGTNMLERLEEDAEHERIVPAEKRRRTRDKHGVTYVDSHTGERLRLYPKMSMW